MSNLEFIMILLKAFWPLTLLAGIAILILLADLMMANFFITCQLNERN